MDVAVDESGRHEGTVEILYVGVRKLTTPHLIAAQPGDDIAADRHGGGVGMGGTMHPPVHQQRGRCHGKTLMGDVRPYR
jgi:hypothetical protein